MAQTSLAQGAQLVQAHFMYASETDRSGDEPQGQLATGEHALHRIYRAGDGYLFLAGTKSDRNRLAAVPALSGVPLQGEEDETERVRFLEHEIEKRPVDFWVEAFNQAGLGCHAVNTIEDIRREYLHEITSELDGEWDDGRSISAIRIVDHPVGGYVDAAPPAYVRLKNAAMKLGYPCPPMGAHTREILQELGYERDQIDAWVSNGVVKERFHPEYLPS
jgi:crotonobetainyl-CoA:carnitine CoA-transferase CaiB-like acyl-CoA transferase